MTGVAWIGIAGSSGSGKSTLASALARIEPATVLCLDDYYLDLERLGPELRETRNYDHPAAIDWALFESHLDAIAAGRAVEAPRYDFKQHRRAGSRRMELTGRWLILEGVFLLHRDAVRGRLDLSLFVDAPDEVRLLRRIGRDTAERGREAGAVREQYERTVRPMYLRFVRPTRAHADLVLQATGGVERLAATVAERVRGLPLRDRH